MKISILTVSYNAAATIRDTIESVSSQHNADIEYIIVDGKSNDGTEDIIRSAGSKVSRWISEPDNGIYDAMNKAIRLATGDIVGILNADDYYTSPHIIQEVMTEFDNPDIDAVFGNLTVVSADKPGKVVRTYSSKNWHPDRFAWGYMPAHPTFFVRRRFYESIGLFKTDYRIAADYELLIRFLYVNRLRYKYIDRNMVTMRKGGVSSRGIRSNIILNNEIIRACSENGIQTSLPKVYSKYLRKVFELF